MKRSPRNEKVPKNTTARECDKKPAKNKSNDSGEKRETQKISGLGQEIQIKQDFGEI